jgi:hypothetical protein
MALNLPIPVAESQKTKEVATKFTIANYQIFRNVEQGVAASHIVIDLVYGNEKETTDAIFQDTNLFAEFQKQTDFINCKLGELFAKLNAAVEAQTITPEQVQTALATLKAADDANVNAILAFIQLLQNAGIVSLPTEEISRLV